MISRTTSPATHPPRERAAATPLRVQFRLYEELNDYLPPAWRKTTFGATLPRRASVATALRQLGIPAAAVDLVLVNGAAAPLDHRLQRDDRVSVYPVFERFDITPLLRPRRRPLRRTRFISADLPRLIRALRALGFDARWCGGYRTDRLLARARREHRIVLTRSPALARREDLTHCLLVRPRATRAQIRSVLEALDLRRRSQPTRPTRRHRGDARRGPMTARRMAYT